MLSKLDKAEKNPNEGWKGRLSLVSYSSDEEDEISKSDSQEDEVLLLDTGSDDKKHLKSNDNKNPLDYRKTNSYKIPKKSVPKATTLSNGTTTSSPSSPMSSSYNVKKMGFESTFSPTKHDFKSHRTTKRNNIRSMLLRQWNSASLSQKVYNKSSTPKPNLNNSRCRKQERPFEADIDMISGAKSPNERKSHQQNEDEKCNSHTTNACTSSGRLKGNDYFIKSNDKDILSAISLSESEEETKDQPVVSKETLKSVSHENCQSNLSSDSQEEESESDSSRRHTYPSSSNSCNDNDEGTTTGCNHSIEVSRRHSFPSSSATPRPPIHNINENNIEDGSSNKKSFYGNLLSNFYPFNNKTSTENKTLPSQNDNEKKRKLTCGDEESNFKEPSQKKKYQKKYSKTRRKIAPPSPAKVEIISSDEEEEKEVTKKPEDQSSPSTTLKSTQDMNPNQENNTAKPKSKTANGASFDRDGYRAEIILGPKILLGSLEVAAKGTLEISFDQLKWKMEHNDKTVTILVQPNEFTALKIHVDADPKIIVLEVTQCLALRLRERFPGNGKFLDPGSPVTGEKDIILEIDDNPTQESIADLSEWVSDTHGKEFEELSLEEAQKLIVRHTSLPGTKPRTYNTRSTTTSSRTTNSNVSPTKMIIYPPPPQHGSITVTTADLECLAQGEFLNDVIIDFYLKYIYHDILTEKERERTHIFSSYFYKRLTQKSTNDTEGGLLSSVDRMRKMHDRVKKWTRNVDLFAKDFIVVPINESSHWFLAIICFPHLDEPIEEEEILSESNDADEVDVEDTDDSDFVSTTSTSKKNSANLPVLKSNPCILIFDSLGGSGRARVTLNLRGYLTCEWKNKRPNKPEKEFSKESIKGTFPKVPHQDNHCDCGVFVLEYVESFFKDPIKNYRAPIDKSKWFTQQKVYSKRQEIKNLIYELKNRASDEEPSCTEDKSD